MRPWRNPTSCVPWAALAVVVLATGVAHADPAADAAARANEVNRTYCGDAYSLDVALASDATVRVAEDWRQVDEAPAATDEPYLLFWRGVLAQCLGRPESARDDLEGFLAWQTQATGFDDLARQARTRLRRIDRKRGLGTGPVVAYLHAAPAVEIAARYAGGVLVQTQACADDPGSDSINSVCVGGSELWKSDVMPAPVLPGLALSVFPAERIGAEVRVSFAVSPRSTLGMDGGRMPETSLGPRWAFHAGPTFVARTHRAPGARAARLRVTPSFALLHGRVSPWAGNVTSTIDSLLFAGTYRWTAPGAGMDMELAVQIGSRVALRVAPGGGVSFLPRTASVEEVEGPSDEVEILPEPAGLLGGFAHARLGVLLPLGDGGTALAPSVAFLWQTTTLRYPNDLEHDIWYADVSLPEGDRIDERKVYSTRQDLVTVGLELELRIGLARPGG